MTKTTGKPRRAKTPRPQVRHDGIGRVTTFPQVKGKVVREVRFSHDDPNNVLAIAFKERTVLYFDINPEALIFAAGGPGELRRGEPERA